MTIYGDREYEKLLTFMDVAVKIGELGTCDRRQVGAVIVRDGRCVSWGYNGAPPGLLHCDENNHGWDKQIAGCYIKTPNGNVDVRQEEDLWAMITTEVEEPMTSGHVIGNWASQKFGCLNATHAEANALAFAARQGISTDEATLFVGTSPCENCARLIIAAGIVAVYYQEEYRKDDGVRLLTMVGIQSEKL